ncbi:hypothetical protein THERMOT_2062 [Bathymodiolus thermophilus thioautotrophic gill symbiont]|nr:hypothetical protein THERMOT_2062 [Bathymodiolus thermophilus thioautotrophic gill symbiont]
MGNHQKNHFSLTWQFFQRYPVAPFLEGKKLNFAHHLYL